jgi:hypothetical protein
MKKQKIAQSEQRSKIPVRTAIQNTSQNSDPKYQSEQQSKIPVRTAIQNTSQNSDPKYQSEQRSKIQ